MDIEKLKALYAETTKGWETDDDGIVYDTDGDPVCRFDCGDANADFNNSEFVAYAHQAMPLLIEAAQLIIELSGNFKAEEDDATFDKALDLAVRLKG